MAGITGTALVNEIVNIVMFIGQFGLVVMFVAINAAEYVEVIGVDMTISTVIPCSLVVTGKNRENIVMVRETCRHPSRVRGMA